MITAQQKQELERRGFYVEDMGAEYGVEWSGHFRWLHPSGQFQETDPSCTAEDAWESCFEQNKE